MGEVNFSILKQDKFRMIINHIHKRKNSIAIGLLVAFNIVFGSNFLCDVGIMKTTAISKTHEHAAIDGHDHDHFANEESHHHGQEHAHQKHQKQNKDEEDDCCEEEISLLFASLVQNRVDDFELDEAPVLNTIIQERLLTYRFVFYKKHNPYTLKNALSPPLSGLQIRVLHQSFLC